MNQGLCVFQEGLYLTSLHDSHVIATVESLMIYSRYDIHSIYKCLYGRLFTEALYVLAIVASAVHNASDMLRDILCMEFAGYLKTYVS